MGIIDELKSERVKKDTNIDKLIDSMYTSCLQIIKFNNKNGITKLTYEIPIFSIGYPLYPREQVGLKFNAFLKKKGFKTLYKDYKIYISW